MSKTIDRFETGGKRKRDRLKMRCEKVRVKEGLSGEGRKQNEI